MLADDLTQYLVNHSNPLSKDLNLIIEKTRIESNTSHMLSGPLVSSLLRFLTRIARPQFILDLGTYTGFSALSMLEVIAPTAKLRTCEINIKHIKMSKENFKTHPLRERIEFYEGSVKDCLDSLEKEPDLVFLDANKNTYIDYYQLIVSKLAPGGLLVIDDVLWRDLATPPKRERQKRMDQINKMVLKDPRVENLLLPIRNGVNVIYKL